MRIGIDFDNTIACYDGVFHAAALERGLISANIGRDKNSIRDHLNSTGRNDDFTKLQGYIYGTRMNLVALYPGFVEFVAAARKAGHELFIVSHKTRHPMLGPGTTCTRRRKDFMAARGLVGRANTIANRSVAGVFELTKQDKVARVAAFLRCPGFYRRSAGNPGDAGLP